MKVSLFDKGVCGLDQTFYLGTVDKNTDAAEGTQLKVTLPAHFRIIGFGIDVKTAFASATLTLSGDQEEPVKYLDGVALNAVGFTDKDGGYAEVGEKDVVLTAKLSAEESGEGSADLYVKVVRLEV